MPIITDKDAKPVAFHTPTKVPLHWTEQVKRAGKNRAGTD